MKDIIDHKTIEIPLNFCLVKPDKNHDKFHFNGKETDIIVGTTAEVYVDPEDSLDFTKKETVTTQANHWGITGEVIAIPKKLEYNGRRIKKITSQDSITNDDILKMNRLLEYSLKHDTPLEVKNGDKVLFSPHAHVFSADNSASIETDIGTLFFIRYDELRGIVREDEVYPLNGVVFFKWIQSEEKKMGDSALFVGKKRIWDADPKEGLIGEVISIGANISSDLEGFIVSDKDDYSLVKPGCRFLFYGISSNNVETEGHFHLFGGEEVLMIRQKDILAILE